MTDRAALLWVLFARLIATAVLAAGLCAVKWWGLSWLTGVPYWVLVAGTVALSVLSMILDPE